MLSLGLNFESLPGFITTNIDRLSVMMTPLVLLVHWNFNEANASTSQGYFIFFVFPVGNCIPF